MGPRWKDLVPIEAALFEASGLPLPASYLALMQRFNGINVSEGDGDTMERLVIPVRDLAEPMIWPIDAYGDNLALADVDLAGIEDAFVFGALGDSGYFVFDVTDEAPVFWVPSDFSSAPITPLAPSLAAFVTLLAEYRLCPPEVLRAARVPRWGG